MSGTTLSGEPLALPADAKGHAAMLVVGFTKAAVKATRPWIEACRADGSMLCFDVRMLESVPRWLRGTVERGMRSGYPPELQRRTLLVYEGNDAWRKVLNVSDDDAAYVVVLDSDSTVRATATGPCSPDALRKILPGTSSR